ncbi:MAG TPA: ArgP/LysG family DNA-binding transcriptional regulator [Micromonosporaceae bacterium]|nr:ArgP/LysG family DNA-binding transcriptional regulator [Micromonosporaceae bacterium]
MALDSQQLATFAAVIREGSFEAAARQLHVTPSAISQRIRALEQSVGQILIQRTKPSVATEAGRPLLRLAGQIAVLESEALGSAEGDLARATVVVNADSLATWFLPVLTAVPLLFELREDDEEHTTDLLREGSVMAAVTAQNVAVQGCRVDRLGSMRYVAVASPELVGRFFTDGVTAEALAAAPMVVFNRKDQLQHRFLRTVTKRLMDPPIHYVPSVWAFGEAIRLGLGWGMIPEQLARPDLKARLLAELAPGRHLDVPLYWQYWRLDSQTIHALTAAVKAAAARALRR